MDQISEIYKLHLDYNCNDVIYGCAIPRFYSFNEIIQSVNMHDIHNFLQTVNHSTTYLSYLFSETRNYVNSSNYQFMNVRMHQFKRTQTSFHTGYPFNNYRKFN